MTYSETLSFLFSNLPAFHRMGKSAYNGSLDNILRLDEYLNHPHTRFKSIHVAGTNGKGSVSHLLASMLQEAGYKTGLYTSPHLKDLRERIRVNGVMISKDEVVNFVGRHQSVIEEVKPSFFEMVVAMAFDFFARQEVDIAVIETGLGGRLDSTNIITPMLSVITNIGLEHTAFLGNTYQQIAGEKAGIIKHRVPVVIGETHPLTKQVFETKAHEQEADISFADNNWECSFLPPELAHPADDSERNFRQSGVDYRYIREVRKFIIHDKAGKSADIKGVTPLCGDYQIKNLQTFAGAYDILKDTLNISEENFIDGILKVIDNTGLMGRWQVIGQNPLVVCDTGHNRAGIQDVIAQVEKIPREKLHCILGFSNDKDLDAILPLFPADAEYYFTKACVERAMPEDRLQHKASEFRLYGNTYKDVASALSAACKSASPNDVVFVGGSIFVVAEVL